jgi:hypothetical protein
MHEDIGISARGSASGASNFSFTQLFETLFTSVSASRLRLELSLFDHSRLGNNFVRFKVGR